MKRSWIKLYLEILDDPKLGRLAVWLRWRFVELLLVAAESDQSGTLPPVTQLAWRLRVGEADLVKSLRSLREIGVVCQQGGRWKVTNFSLGNASCPRPPRNNHQPPTAIPHPPGRRSPDAGYLFLLCSSGSIPQATQPPGAPFVPPWSLAQASIRGAPCKGQRALGISQISSPLGT
jgi:hypothetical protein